MQWLHVACDLYFQLAQQRQNLTTNKHVDRDVKQNKFVAKSATRFENVLLVFVRTQGNFCGSFAAAIEVNVGRIQLADIPCTTPQTLQKLCAAITMLAAASKLIRHTKMDPLHVDPTVKIHDSDVKCGFFVE